VTALGFPFVRDGYRHALVERQGTVCLVARTNRRTGSVHWEVVILRAVPTRAGPGGIPLPAGERYPASNDWGRFGWTYTTQHEAAQKYRVLCARGAVEARREAEQGNRSR
jgi:hypothetical protein